MKKEVDCQRLCDDVTVSAEQAQFINARIRENYAVNWLVDGLPAGHVRSGREPDTEVYSIGFPLGQEDDADTPSLNNHYEIAIDYHHNLQKDMLRVVGIVVLPMRYVLSPQPPLRRLTCKEPFFFHRVMAWSYGFSLQIDHSWIGMSREREQPGS